MWTFGALTIAGLILLLGGALFGHDHDVNHDIGHSDHGSGSNEPTVSIFSMKVIGTFIMGFGGGGFIGRYEGADILISSLWGLLAGLLMGLCMYLVMRLLYGQQSNSLVQTNSLVGSTGIVVTSIDINSIGQVRVEVGAAAPTYLARAVMGKSFARGTRVVVVSTNGSEVVVNDQQG